MRFSGADTVWRASMIAVGVLVGAGVYTFWFARGYSYLLDNPEACVNCHVMRDNYHSWLRSSHQSVTCNGCHVPHNFVGKWLTKAENGFNHSVAFTLGPPEVIRAHARQRRVIQQNCLYCHERTVALITGPHQQNDRPCYECHRGVGHPF